MTPMLAPARVAPATARPRLAAVCAAASAAIGAIGVAGGIIGPTDPSAA